MDYSMRYGHNALAAHFIEGDVKRGGSNFSKFFHEALVGKGDPWKETVRQTSAVKKADWFSRCVTPLHCACINPDTGKLSLSCHTSCHSCYSPDTGPLEALFRVNPDLYVTDSDQKKLVHYAAACQDVGPIKFLESKGANFLDTDKEGNTPLMIACKIGRVKTAKFIIEKVAKQEEQSNDLDIFKKFGRGGVNRPGKDSWCPLHTAVVEHHPDIVSLLLLHGADPDKQLSANYDKVILNHKRNIIKYYPR